MTKVSAMNGTESIYAGSTNSSVSSEKTNYEFYNIELEPNVDSFVSKNYEHETKMYKTQTNANVTENYINGKMTSREIYSKKWSSKVEWDNAGNVKVVDYHVPKGELGNKKDSYRLEIKPNGEYTLELRNRRQKNREVINGNIKDDSFKEIKVQYIDETIDLQKQEIEKR